MAPPYLSTLRLPPYRPPWRKVAHLLGAALNVESRNAFGPMLTYFGSNRLKPLSGTSRVSLPSTITLPAPELLCLVRVR